MWAHRTWGSTTDFTRSNQKPPTKHLWIQALASLRSQAPVFSGMSNQILSLPCQPQYNSSSIHLLLGQPFGDRFCTIYQLLLVVLANSPITIFWICHIQAVGEALHSLLYISFPEFAEISTNSIIPYLLSLCLVSVALFSCLQVQPVFYFTDIFSTHVLLISLHFTPR